MASEDVERSAAEAWSVDPTIRFDRIHILESLPGGFAGRSGLRLAEQLEGLAAGGPVRVVYHRVDGKEALRSVLQALVSEAEGGNYPLIHIEAHGADRPPARSSTSLGIVLESSEVVPWTDLTPYFVEINRATRLRLLVYVATCFGADVATIVRPTDRAPMRVLIGPKDSISMGALEVGTNTFYRSLLANGNGNQALHEMNGATDNAFFPFSAEWLFLKILEQYFNEHTSPEQVAARAERIVAQMVLRGASWDETEVARRRMREFLSDRRSVFDEQYRKFFFIDVHPENAERFRMTFESCFQEAGP